MKRTVQTALLTCLLCSCNLTTQIPLDPIDQASSSGQLWQAAATTTLGGWNKRDNSYVTALAHQTGEPPNRLQGLHDVTSWTRDRLLISGLPLQYTRLEGYTYPAAPTTAGAQEALNACLKNSKSNVTGCASALKRSTHAAAHHDGTRWLMILGQFTTNVIAP